MSTSIAVRHPLSSVPRIRLRPQVSVRRTDWLAITLLAAHIPFGVLLTTSTYLPTIHGVVTAAVGVYVAISHRKRLERVAYISAYIVGAEVVWRMTKSQLPWEFGKYAMSGIFLICLILHRRRGRRSYGPLVYFALLIPSTLLTMTLVDDFTQLHRTLSFYLSGPLALAMAWWFFSKVELSTRQAHRLFLALLCPTVSVASIALFSTFSHANVTFTAESNFVTSGGFGPNQVSGALGLGITVALVWLLTQRGRWLNKAVIFTALVFLATQAALTFSRGGLYNALGASLPALFFLGRDRKSRVQLIVAIAALLFVGSFIIWPKLQEFTGGAISARFQDTNMANRDTLIRSELNLWRENPIFGVGLGRAVEHSRLPHTEITRLLAEHGVFGLAALCVLLICAAKSVKEARTAQGKALSSAMVVFSLLFMIDKAMRLAAPSFAFGLSFVKVTPDQKSGQRPSSLNRRAARRRWLRERSARFVRSKDSFTPSVGSSPGVGPTAEMQGS